MAGKKLQLEDGEQAALFDWARVDAHPLLPAGKKIGDYLFAIPNGGNRNVREAARLKRQGVKAGVSDCFLPIPAGAFNGLWIEMKKQRQHFGSMAEANRALSDPQKNWFGVMRALNYECVCCYGWEEAREAILHYLMCEPL